MNHIALNIALPLLGAFLLPLIHHSAPKIARLVGPAILLGMCWISAFSMHSLEQPVALALGGFLPPLGISFHIDQLSLLLAIIIPLMLLLLWPYKQRENFREDSLLLLLAAAASGMALSGDLFNIYVFYELLSVASFGLAVSQRNAASFAATFRYLVMSGLGTVLALTGIGLIYTQTGTLNLAHIGLLAAQLDNSVGLAAFALIVLGIGVKAEVFPVNGWVAEVYATAKPRISALLAGLISKLAVLVMVRLLVVAYANSDALLLLLVLGMLGIIWGELSAWRAKDLKRLLAYSSIGQLGMVLVAFSIPGEAGMFAGIAMMLHHLLVKPALFLLTESWNGSVACLAGTAKQSPLAAALFILFALSLIGVPPFPGFWAKLIMVTGLVGAADPVYLFALVILLSATVIEANYLMRTALRIYAPAEKELTQPQAHSLLNLGIISTFGLVLISTLIGIAPLGNRLSTIASEAGNRNLYIETTFSAGKMPSGMLSMRNMQ